MKKVLFLSAIMISGLASSVASASPSEFYVYRACQALPEMTLPNSCVATCEKIGEATFILTLSQGAKSTSVEVGYTERASRKVEGDMMTIEGGAVGGQYLYLQVDSNDKVHALTLNDLECK